MLTLHEQTHELDRGIQDQATCIIKEKTIRQVRVHVGTLHLGVPTY